MSRILTLTSTRTVSVPDYGQHLGADELMALVTSSGSHFFDRDTMRWFKSRMHDVFVAPNGWYFITSEKHEALYASINEPRRYTLRKLVIGKDDVRILEVEEFQHYSSLNRARTAARRAVEEDLQLCLTCSYRLAFTPICQGCRDRAERMREPDDLIHPELTKDSWFNRP